MRYALAAASAFAAGAIAAPYKPHVVYDIDIVYKTKYVTVTAGVPLAPAPPATFASSSSSFSKHGHDHQWYSDWSYTTEVIASSTEIPVFTSADVAPSTSTYVASTTSTYAESTTSTYVESTTSDYVAPTIPDYVAPTTVDQVVPSSYASKPTSYADKVVFHHNLHRANHSSPDIAWDDDLASTAEKIAAGCVYAHDTTTDGGGYGQNIAAGVEADNVTAIITDLFYNGEVGFFEGLYGQDQPDMTNFELWGHFAQIVWKDTTRVGCATYDCSSKGLANVGGSVAPFFTVCNYKSPGNYANEYADNIGVSKGEPTVWWNASS